MEQALTIRFKVAATSSGVAAYVYALFCESLRNEWTGDTLCGCALVAQGIEHRSPKAGVGRSNRLGGTEMQNGLVSGRFCVFSIRRRIPGHAVVTSGSENAGLSSMGEK